MKTEVQEKINIMPLEDCLEKISDKQLKELYEESLLVNEEKRPKRMSKEEKIEYICNNLMTKYMAALFFLSSDEIKTLKEAIYNNNLTEISQKLIDNNYIFKLEDKYLIPEEIKEVIKEANTKKIDEDKKNLLVNYYIISNGVLKIERLQSLIKESGFKITKKEINDIAKQYNYIIQNNIIYINEVAKSLDEDNGLIEIKESADYKIVSFEEAMKVMLLIENIDATEEISKILKKKIKNKQKLSIMVEVIFSCILLTEDFEELVEDSLEGFEVDLNEDELDELYSLLEDISHMTPSWVLNGYTPHEMYCNEEDEYELDCSFKNLSEEEKKEIYIFNYVMINGLISIDKLVEILNEKNDIKTNKKDIIKIVKKSDLTDETTIINDYLCHADLSEEDFEMIKSLKKSDKYKVIEDIEKLMDEIEENHIIYNNICDEYNLPEEIAGELNAIMTLGGLTEEIIPVIFEEYNYNMPLKKQQAFFKDLKNVIRNTRMWILNGYTPTELNSTSKSEKVGRNDKCPCGSGKKYKHCCGK